MSERLQAECEAAGLGNRYRELLANGCTPQLANMLAFRQSPAERGTDRSFWEGRLVSEYDNSNGKMMLDMAKKAGINTTGKIYVGGLARTGLGVRDPQAWVSDTGDIKRIAKQRNLDVDGVVTHRAVGEPVETPNVKLAPDIVKRFVKEKAAADPDFARKPKREQAEIVIDKHGAK